MINDCVLLSGGIDSACALAECCAVGAKTEALFVDYGQAAADRERRASRRVARSYGVRWREIGFGAPATGEGELVGRNALLVHIALFVLPPGAPYALHLGVHAGTGYRDCSPEFVAVMQSSLDFHADGRVQLVAPFQHWTKSTVLDRARELGVPIDLTYSCERGGDPCGACRSCLDRETLRALT